MTIADFAQEPPHDIDAEQAILGVCMHSQYIVPHIRRVLPDPTVFFRPAHQQIYSAILELYDGDAPTDPVSVKDLLDQLGILGRCGGHLYLFELFQLAPTAGDPQHHAKIVLRHARRRAGIMAARQALQRLESSDGFDDVSGALTDARDILDKAAHDTAPTTAKVRNIDEFLASVDENAPYDWVIPDLLERHDRLIVTGPEGGGKSTWLRQIGVMAAAGLHPITGEVIDPVRVLSVDLENSELQSARALRPLRVQAGDLLKPDQLHIEVRMAGIDLTQAEDRAWLAQIAMETRPDVLITGPIYKMASGDPTEEKSAKPVAMALDAIRERVGCALVLEAHAPKKPSGTTKRPREPYGWSGWLRWPEFGVWLDEDGSIEHWRGQRDKRKWPAALARGGAWPWSPVSDEIELKWIQIKKARELAGKKMAQRDVSAATGIPRSTVQRVLNRYHYEWVALNEQAGDGDE
ncbi:DnaB-like helicase N-terminal domain-containing protein [Nonomuraea sp. NPDC049709]|uniref:DnaB-like helicase N-terminal domain-containing protein n=1 Tax=Nonomuraea sp. NPDC049709 TaxID=3154736 RepID=UPI00342EAED3